MNTRGAVLVVVAILASGCSYHTTFVVANHGTAPIRVSYVDTARRGLRARCEWDRYERPRVVPVADRKALSGLNDDRLPAADVSCDEATGTVTIAVDPLHAVSVFRIANYDGRRSVDFRLLDVFHIQSLTVTGTSGELRYTGRQLVRDFEREDMTRYVLTYK